MDLSYRIELADSVRGSSNMSLENQFSSTPTVIKVIGVGNGGCNAVNRMIDDGLEGVSFIAMNTDSQALSRSKAPTRIVLGERITSGLGAGTDPERGAEAAREDISRIEELVKGADLVFIASGFGGGTGTGASPIIAEVAKKAGALTIGVITKPFEMEGRLKMKRAEAGVEKMINVVDSLIIIPNENLYQMIEQDTGFEEALSIIDDILRQGVQGISDIITQTGFGINVDFADVKTMISLSNGRAHLGIGVGKGDSRLSKAIKNAFNNPLLDVSSIRNARGVLANIICPSDFTLQEYKEATQIISTYADEEANIKIGVCKKEDLKDEIRITIVATGFDAKIDEDKSCLKKTNENTAVKEIKKDINIDIVKENPNLGFNKVNTADEEKKISNEKIQLPVNNLNSPNNLDDKQNSKLNVMEKNVKQVHNSDIGYGKNNTSDSSNILEIRHTENTDHAAQEKSDNAVKDNRLTNELVQKTVEAPTNIKQADNKSDRLETTHSTIDKKAIDIIARELKEDMDNSSAVNNLSVPFEVISEDEMKLHNLRGAKMIFGESTSEVVDYDTPAFLRRSIQTRKIVK